MESINMTEEQARILAELTQDTLDGLSLAALGVLVADEIFGESISIDDQSLFLAAMIDETQPLQSELVAKLNATFDINGYMEPDRYSCQLFKRKAGYSGGDKRLQKSVTRDPEDDSNPDLLELGQYCAAICLKDYQIVKFGQEEYLLNLEKMTPIFELLPHPTSGQKWANRPAVPSNRTQIKLGNGKGTIKTNKYMSVLVWAFWDGNPSKEYNTTVDNSPLQEVINKLKTDSVFNNEVPINIPEEGVIIS
jgi:hypothetical protein